MSNTAREHQQKIFLPKNKKREIQPLACHEFVMNSFACCMLSLIRFNLSETNDGCCLIHNGST